MNTQQVVAEIIRRSLAFNVTVKLAASPSVDNEGFAVGGYFCGVDRELAVATQRDEQAWLGILLHEYSHLTQWIEGSPLWHGYREDMWAWLDGKPLRDAKAAVLAVQACEADCERRTIRLIRELGAPIDVALYSRAANAYLHFHNVMATERKWYRPGTSMQTIPSLMAACNPTLDTDFTKTPKALREELLRLI
ncbi:MAG: hypothetical protein WAZ50_01415 [Minisyncoccia bacterium]